MGNNNQYVKVVINREDFVEDSKFLRCIGAKWNGEDGKTYNPNQEDTPLSHREDIKSEIKNLKLSKVMALKEDI